ncbi:molybdopterin-guanine dinucleotide biosynthesis protein B [Planococcus sp. APC 3906]|uniref:molybdopterin-guanine dinucleotide biosynthesis protein B n=1 Tax=Planococcus sp. APC 3906 TaxID=3035194 RepID=UPI0025B4B8CA|nr:molybdopterin-guanine dinucleotide biosynthesis protein B [Planococcus sp. APC 3906]MDN3451283.1 molybdopterin-guanine dinucleotide biosynthesis protein B [Planococcus sp. APC 3906]
MDGLTVLQVVGFKDSGKTTLMLELIRQAAASGKTVAAVKHHGHPEPLDMPPATTDSMRFFNGGAAASVVFGGGVIQLHVQKKEAAVEELVAMAATADTDFIFIEGFKDAPYEKIVLIRSDSDWEKLKSLSRIALVIGHEGVSAAHGAVIGRNESDRISGWFADWIERKST